jgi:hypothetical protein
MDNRFLYQEKVIVDNIPERDYLDNTLSTFRMRRQSSNYRIIQEDLQRPDLIAHKVYDNVNLWWFICFINQIVNPFDELVVGEVLIIPSIFDLWDFWDTHKKLS